MVSTLQKSRLVLSTEGTTAGSMPYVMANGILMQEDRVPEGFKKIASLELVIIQAKSSGGITTSSVNSLIANLPRLLKMGRDEDALGATVNSRLLEITRRFLRAWAELAHGVPSVRVLFGAPKVIEVHPNVRSLG